MARKPRIMCGLSTALQPQSRYLKARLGYHAIDSSEWLNYRRPFGPAPFDRAGALLDSIQNSTN